MGPERRSRASPTGNPDQGPPGRLRHYRLDSAASAAGRPALTTQHRKASMPYKGTENFSHKQSERLGVLVTNLGTPDAPTTPALRRYLGEFLWDARVVEVPRPIWWLVLHGIILRIRPKRSAEAYASVWDKDGSPLLIHTANQAEGIRKALQARYGNDVVVGFAMRYGNPSIARVLDEMQEQGVRKLLVLPLYPQYSASTTASTFDALAADFTRRRWLPELRFINHYHDHPSYIDVLVKRIQSFWQEHGRPQKLVFSYHGVPLRYLHEGDPYYCECHKTSRLIAEHLGLAQDDYITTFQSRFGREEWLQPYTDETLKAMPGQGIKHVHVICPGFSVDCLETIEEIGSENRDYFMAAGGEQYAYIPALNAEADHIAALTRIIIDHLHGWTVVQDEKKRAQRAEQGR